MLKIRKAQSQAIATFLLFGAVVGAGVYMIGNAYKERVYTELGAKADENLVRSAALTTNRLDPVLGDLQYLSENETFQDAISNTDDLDFSALVFDWLAFSSAKRQYDQIRWIDENGIERLRVDFGADGPKVTPPSELQSKRDRYYFVNSRALRRGDVYVSPLDLNIERGEIEKPRKPVVRLTTPAFDRAGQRRGIVVLNYLAEPLLDQLRAIDPGNLWLINPDGYWFVGPAAELEWGFMLGRDNDGLQQLYPELWNTFSETDSGEFRNREGTWSFLWISPFGETRGVGDSDAFPVLTPVSSYRWLLVDRIPGTSYAGPIRRMWLVLLTAAGTVLVGFGFLNWRIAKARMSEQRAVSDLQTSNTALSEKVKELDREIISRKGAEGELRSAVELYRAILRNSVESFLLLDREGNVKEANESFCSLVGRRHEQIIGRNIEEFGFEELKLDLVKLLSNVDLHGRSSLEAAIRIGASEDLFVELNLVYLFQSNNVFAFMRNVTDQKIHIGELERNAYYDVLTNLPNRLLLTSRLNDAVEASPYRKTDIALLFIDLDGFKAVNDKFGHDTGDEVLIHIAKRFSSSLRPSDTVARLGGDEFVALLPDVRSRQDVEEVVERFLDAAREPVPSSRGPQTVSASIGVAIISPEDAPDAELMMQRADHAMYQAKMAGKNQFFFSDNRSDQMASASDQVAGEVRQAVEHNQFVLYYQPKVDGLNGEVIGLEALVRWNHPQRGMLSPGAFLPQIETHPVYSQLGAWVRREAVRQVNEWNADGFRMSVSINLSIGEILEASFVEDFKALLAEFPDVSGEQIEIEVLETNEIGGNPAAVETIRQCKQLGIKISIDDFGTGYSSLSQLKQLEVDTLKIDRSFVDNCTIDPDDLSILMAVFSLSSALHCGVVAEGVETVEQGRLLLALGCKHMQGFLIAKPMPASAVLDWSKSWSLPDGLERRVQLNQEDYGLVTSAVFHRAWMRRLRAVASAEDRVDLELDPEQCRFGSWLEKEGRTRYQTYPEMAEIDRLHRRIHELAGELVNQGQQSSGEASARYAEIRKLSKALEDNIVAILIGRSPAMAA